MLHHSGFLAYIRCNAHIHNLNRLIKVQFTLFSIFVHTVVVIDPISHIRAFLNFCNQNAFSDSVNCTCWHKIGITFMDFHFLQVLIQSTGFHCLTQNFFRHLMLETINQVRAFLSINDIPHLCLAIVPLMVSCIRIAWMNLHR